MSGEITKLNGDTHMGIKLRLLVVAALIGDLAWTNSLLGGYMGMTLAASACVLAGFTLFYLVPKAVN